MMLLNIKDGDVGAVNDGGSVLNVIQHNILILCSDAYFNGCRSMLYFKLLLIKYSSGY